MSLPPLLALAEGRRVRPRKAPRVEQSELQLHIGAADILRRWLKPTWRPWHTPSGEHRDPRVGAKLKAMLTKPGIPDLLLLDERGTLRCLELKAAKGRLSDEQEDFRLFCVKTGISYCVARTIDEALAIFQEWQCLTVNVVRPS